MTITVPITVKKPRSSWQPLQAGFTPLHWQPDSDSARRSHHQQSRDGAAQICKICFYIDLCIFCIFDVYFLHIFLTFRMYFAYILHILHVEQFKLSLVCIGIFYAYFLHTAAYVLHILSIFLHFLRIFAIKFAYFCIFCQCMLKSMQ